MGEDQGFSPRCKEHVSRTAADNRLFVNGVLWVLRSGARWSDLPERYDKYKSVHKRFMRWADSGVWERVFQQLVRDTQLTEAARTHVSGDVYAACTQVESSIALPSFIRRNTSIRRRACATPLLVPMSTAEPSLMEFLSAQSDYRTVQLAYVQLIGSYLTATGQLNLALGREAIQ